MKIMIATCLAALFICEMVAQTSSGNSAGDSAVWNVQSYGARCDNSFDDSAAIQAAIDAAAAAGGGEVRLPAGTCFTGTTSIVLKTGVSVRGAAIHGSSDGGYGNIRYFGTGDAIDGRGASHCRLSDLMIHTLQASANGIHLGDNSQHCQLLNVFVDASTTSGNAGIGLFLDGRSRNTFFSGHLVISGFYAIGYRYGIKWSGTTHDQQWTTVDIADVFLIGPAKAAGSIGLWMTGAHSGGGCFIHSGTIESYAKAVQFDDGVIGCDMTLDTERNGTDQPSFGNSANVWFHHSVSGEFYSQTNNYTSNAFDKERRRAGTWYTESRGSRYHVTWNDSGLEQEWGWKRGPSLIDGGTPANAFVVHTSDSASMTDPRYNYIALFSGTTQSFGSAPPASGQWSKGSIVWNTNPSPGSALGWVCTKSGNPATWTQVGYVSNSTSSNTAKIDALQVGESGSTITDSRSLAQFGASLTTSAANTDTVAIPGVTSSSRCSLTPTNASAAAAAASLYVSAKTADRITVAHAATRGMTYDIVCTAK